MAAVVWGKEGDDVIITRIDLGMGDEYLVEVRYMAGYHTVYSTFDFDKAVAKAQQCNPKF